MSRRIERAGRQQNKVEPRRRQVPTSHLPDAQIRKWPDAVVSYINRTATPFCVLPEAHLTLATTLSAQAPRLFVILCLGNMIENLRESSFHHCLAKQLPAVFVISVCD